MKLLIQKISRETMIQTGEISATKEDKEKPKKSSDTTVLDSTNSREVYSGQRDLSDTVLYRVIAFFVFYQELIDPYTIRNYQLKPKGKYTSTDIESIFKDNLNPHTLVPNKANIRMKNLQSVLQEIRNDKGISIQISRRVHLAYINAGTLDSNFVQTPTKSPSSRVLTKDDQDRINVALKSLLLLIENEVKYLTIACDRRYESSITTLFTMRTILDNLIELDFDNHLGYRNHFKKTLQRLRSKLNTASTDV